MPYLFLYLPPSTFSTFSFSNLACSFLNPKFLGSTHLILSWVKGIVVVVVGKLWFVNLDFFCYQARQSGPKSTVQKHCVYMLQLAIPTVQMNWICRQSWEIPYALQYSTHFSAWQSSPWQEAAHLLILFRWRVNPILYREVKYNKVCSTVRKMLYRCRVKPFLYIQLSSVYISVLSTVCTCV